jgi:hypothetical protein
MSPYNPAHCAVIKLGGFMSEENQDQVNEDSFADAISAVAVVVIPVVAIVYWLSGLPTS